MTSSAQHYGPHPASTYRSEADDTLPAMRGAGKEFYGLKGLDPVHLELIKSQDLAWYRAAEGALRLSSRGRPWAIAYEELDVNCGPHGLLIVDDLFKRTDVKRHSFNIRSLWLCVYTHGVDFEPKLYEDMDEFYCHLLPLLRDFAIAHAAVRGDVCRLPATRADADAQAPATRAGDGRERRRSRTPRRPCPPAHGDGLQQGSWLGKVSYYARRKPAPEHEEDVEASTIGGLRRTATALAKLPRVVAAGRIIGRALDALYDRRPDIQECLLRAIGDKSEHNPDVEAAGQDIADHIAETIGCHETRRGITMGLECELRAGLIDGWQRYAEDPDDQVPAWLRQGAPMGIALKPEPRGIFPVYDDVGAASNPSLLASDLGADEYKSPHDETHQAEEELKKMVGRKLTHRFK